jgi:hypothetical protein
MRAVATALAAPLLAAAPAQAEPRKLTTAQALSGVGTGVSGALFLSAFVLNEKNGDVNLPLVYAGLGSSVVTPALGHWYVGHYLTPGTAMRAGAALLSTWAVSHYSQTERCGTVEFKECTGLRREAIIFLGISAIAFVGGAALDFKTLPDAVADYNARFTVTPTLMPTTSGPPGAGLSLTGAF